MAREISKADLLKRIELLENDNKQLAQEIVTMREATHEHSISPETILHIADIVKADIASSLLPQQKATEEVQE